MLYSRVDGSSGLRQSRQLPVASCNTRSSRVHRCPQGYCSPFLAQVLLGILSESTSIASPMLSHSGCVPRERNIMKTILLADDEAYLRLLVQTTLDDDAYRILEATDGNQTLTMARAEHPDLLVLDWMMPGLSGLTVAQMLRRDPATAQMPIIML